jgi:hypothetical protein
VFVEILYLPFQPQWKTDVVAVHARNVLTAGTADSEIQSERNAAKGWRLQYSDLAEMTIFSLQIFPHLRYAGVHDDEEFKVLK